ncbi:unnamed protein product [Sympodiomycopsis kandeliae]
MASSRLLARTRHNLESYNDAHQSGAHQVSPTGLDLQLTLSSPDLLSVQDEKDARQNISPLSNTSGPTSMTSRLKASSSTSHKTSPSTSSIRDPSTSPQPQSRSPLLHPIRRRFQASSSSSEDVSDRRKSKGSGLLGAFKNIAASAGPSRRPSQPQKSFEVVRVRGRLGAAEPTSPLQQQPRQSQDIDVKDKAQSRTSSDTRDHIPPRTSSDFSSKKRRPSQSSAFGFGRTSSRTSSDFFRRKEVPQSSPFEFVPEEPPLNVSSDDQLSYFPPMQQFASSDSAASARSRPFSAADEYSVHDQADIVVASPDEEFQPPSSLRHAEAAGVGQDAKENASAAMRTEHSSQKGPASPQLQPASRSTSTNPPSSAKNRNSLAAITRRFSGMSGLDNSQGGVATTSPQNDFGATTSGHTTNGSSFTLRSMRNVTDTGTTSHESSGTTRLTHTASPSADVLSASPGQQTSADLLPPLTPLITPHTEAPQGQFSSPLMQGSQPQSPVMSGASSSALKMYDQPQGSSISVAKFKNPRRRSESGTFSPDIAGAAGSRAASPGPAFGLQTPDGLRPSEQLAALEAELAMGGRATSMLRNLEERYETSSLRSHLAHAEAGPSKPGSEQRRLDSRASLDLSNERSKDPFRARQRRQASLDASHLMNQAGATSPFGSAPAPPKQRRFSERLENMFSGALGLSNPPTASNDPTTSSPDPIATAHTDTSQTPSQSPRIVTTPFYNTSSLPASPQLVATPNRGRGRGWDSATFLSNFAGQSGSREPRTLLEALNQMEDQKEQEQRRQSIDLSGQIPSSSNTNRTLAPAIDIHLDASLAQRSNHTSTYSLLNNTSMETGTSQAAEVLLALAATPEPNSFRSGADDESYFPPVKDSAEAQYWKAMPVQTTQPVAVDETPSLMQECEPEAQSREDLPEQVEQRNVETAHEKSSDLPYHESRSQPPQERVPAEDFEAASLAEQLARRPSLRIPRKDSLSGSAPPEHRHGIDLATMQEWQAHADKILGRSSPIPLNNNNNNNIHNKHRKAHSVSHATRSRKNDVEALPYPPPVQTNGAMRGDRSTAMENADSAISPVRSMTLSAVPDRSKHLSKRKVPAISMPHAGDYELTNGSTKATHPAPDRLYQAVGNVLPLGIKSQYLASMTVEQQEAMHDRHARAIQLAAEACKRAFNTHMSALWRQIPQQALLPDAVAFLGSSDPSGGQSTASADTQALYTAREHVDARPDANATQQMRHVRQETAPATQQLVPHWQPTSQHHGDSRSRQASEPTHQHLNQQRQTLHGQPPRHLHNQDSSQRLQQQGSSHSLQQPALQYWDADGARSRQQQQDQQHQHRYQHHTHQHHHRHQQQLKQQLQQHYPQPQPQPQSHLHPHPHYQQQQQQQQQQQHPHNGQYPQPLPRQYNHAALAQHSRSDGHPASQFGGPPTYHPPHLQTQLHQQQGSAPREAFDAPHPAQPLHQKASNFMTSQQGHPSHRGPPIARTLTQAPRIHPVYASESFQIPKDPMYQHRHAVSSSSLHSRTPPPPAQRRPSVPHLKVNTDEASRRPSAKFMATPIVDTSSIPLPAFDAVDGAHINQSGGAAVLTDELKRMNQSRGVTPGEYSSTKRYID